MMMTLLRPTPRALLLSIATVTALMLPTPGPALASFSASPTKVEIQVDPGQSATGTIRVSTKAAGETYAIDVGDARQNADGSYKFLNRSTDPNMVSSWMHATPKSFVSGLGVVEPITWTIKVPKDADPGDHVGIIYITQVATKKKEGVTLQSRLAIGMVVTVTGTITWAPVVTKLSIPGLSSKPPIPISVTIQNKGNVRLDLEQAKTRRVVIRRGSKVVKTFDLDQSTIYPGAIRKFSFSWKDAPGSGTFSAHVDITTEGHPKVAGPTPHFRIVPYKQVGAIVLSGIGGLVIILTLLIRLMRARRRRQPSSTSTGGADS